jgi:hypothetical protein
MGDLVAGVPADEVTADDFIMVRAALVRRLGGANEALIWTRIHYRIGRDSQAAHETESGRWWSASYGAIGDEVGLSAKQTRTAIDNLVAGGFLLTEQHRLSGNYDQTYSYQTVIIEGQMHVPKRADEYALEGNSHVPKRADDPSIKTLKKKSIKDVPPEAVALCDLLEELILANGSKKPVTTSWANDARKIIEIDKRDPAAAARLIRWCQDDSFWRGNILSMGKFREKYDTLRLQANRELEQRRAQTNIKTHAFQELFADVAQAYGSGAPRKEISE